MCWQLITLLTVWILHGLCLVILKICKSTQEMSGSASQGVWSFDMECWPQTTLLFISCLWHLALWKDEGRDSQEYFEQIQLLLVHGDRRVVCLFLCQPWEVNYWVLHMNSVLRIIPAHLIVLNNMYIIPAQWAKLSTGLLSQKSENMEKLEFGMSPLLNPTLNFTEQLWGPTFVCVCKEYVRSYSWTRGYLLLGMFLLSQEDFPLISCLRLHFLAHIKISWLSHRRW